MCVRHHIVDLNQNHCELNGLITAHVEPSVPQCNTQNRRFLNATRGKRASSVSSSSCANVGQIVSTTTESRRTSHWLLNTQNKRFIKSQKHWNTSGVTVSPGEWLFHQVCDCFTWCVTVSSGQSSRRWRDGAKSNRRWHKVKVWFVWTQKKQVF